MAAEESWQIQGRKVTLPCEVRDASAGTVMYMVDAVEAQRLVPEPFEVLEPAPGLTQLSLLMVDYRDNDLGDYNEVGVIFFVRPRGASDAAAGTYIHQLPVDQSFTCEAGCKIWGFPKTVQDIDFDYGDDTATCRLVMDGQHVFTLTLPRGGDDSTEDAPSTGYTLIDGVPHSNEFTRGGSGEQTLPGGEGVALELGEHPLAEELRKLGLPKDPILSNWSEHMRGRFGASVPL
ncbi:MAG: acetoacetate decarboxylase family protein [Deltaproteobacteria bacterium]|nr:acetoacetate decarboxylase family protein [Deltaproteobacteria bacterium]